MKRGCTDNRHTPLLPFQGHSHFRQPIAGFFRVGGWAGSLPLSRRRLPPVFLPPPPLSPALALALALGRVQVQEPQSRPPCQRVLPDRFPEIREVEIQVDLGGSHAAVPHE